VDEVGRGILLARVLTVAGVAVLSGVGCTPHDGCQGCDAAMWVAAWSGIKPRPTYSSCAVIFTRRPGKDRTSAGAELGVVLLRQAILASSRVHQNSVPSTQIQCRITAILRATAMRAFLGPIRLANRVPQAFRGEKRFTLVSNTFAAS
jgi:hypothetical protein